MKKNSLKHEGVTLIEVIISLAFITVLIVGIYSFSINSIKNNKSGEIKQKASLYGQRILEDFRSKDVIKTESSDESELILSNGIKLKDNGSGKKVGSYDLGDGYKADIEVEKNISGIGSGQEIQGNASPSDYAYAVKLKKNSLNSASISEGSKWEQTSIDETKCTEIDVYVEVDTKQNKKTISVKVPGLTSLTKDFYFNSGNLDADKNKEITLSINCSEYNLSKDDKENDEGFEVHVFNYDKVPINICLQKDSIIDGTAVTEAGKCKLYNNRPISDIVSDGDLYDISVFVKNNNEDPVDNIFEGSISQNLRITKQ